MKTLRIFSFFLLVSSWAWADQRTWPAKEIQSFFIQVSSLHLTFKESNSPFYKIEWEGDLNIKNEEGQLKIQSRDFFSLKKQPKEIKKIRLKLSGPSKPVEIFANLSHISISRWKSSVFISSFDGNIQANKTKAPWEVSLKTGQVTINEHKAPLKIKAFKLNLKVSKSKGPFDFLVSEGSLRIKESEGFIQYVSDSSKIRLIKFKGDFNAFSRSGDIRASFVKTEKTDLKTETGDISLYFANQGPRINTYTNKGRIYAPKYLNKKFKGKSTYVSGRIISSVKTGEVSVESDLGNIYIN